MGLVDERILNKRKITSEHLCYCGSGNIYRECCKKQPHDSRLSKEEIKNIEKVVSYSGNSPKQYRKRILEMNEKCFISSCKEKAIWSHTISANWMKKVFKSSYVAVPWIEWKKYFLNKLPINQASIFYWWCQKHDHDIFQEIDQNFDLSNRHHLNLMAYRTISKEFRIKENHLRQLYSFLYLSDKCNKELCLWNLLAEYLWVYDHCQLMDFIYNGIQSKFRSGLTHRIFKLWSISPLFLSSAITPNWKPTMKNYQVLSLNIYTQNDKNGYFIMSYKNVDKESKNLYEKIKKEEKRKNLISFLNELISKNCDNIVCDESRVGEKLLQEEDEVWFFFPYDTPTFDYIKPLSSNQA